MKVPEPSFVGDHTKLDPAFYVRNCSPQRRGRGQLRWDGSQVCIRCTAPLGSKDQADQKLILDHWCWVCSDEKKCSAQQTENRKAHKQEIDYRLERHAKRCTHLIVVQDIFGHEFGYGNFHVLIKPGQDLDAIVKSYTERQYLVIDAVIPMGHDDDDQQV